MLWVARNEDGDRGMSVDELGGAGPHDRMSGLPGILQILPNVLDRLPVGIHIEDADLRSVYINEEFTRIFGYRIDEIELPELWWPMVYPDEAYRAQVQDEWFRAVATAKQNNTEIPPQEWRVTCRGGIQKIVQFHYRAVGDYHVHAYVDVTTRHKLDAELREFANTDPLTGLSNRRHFFAAAAAQMATPMPAAVLLIDVDHFKSVNDRFGHAVGDVALAQVAGLCRAALAGEGLLARWGGEEFAAFLPGLDAGAAQRMAERIRGQVSGADIVVEGGRLTISVSVGGACRLDGEATLDGLLLRADKALYAAKAAGRDRVVFA